MLKNDLCTIFKIGKILSSILLLIGVGFIIFALALMNQTTKHINNSIMTQGKVIEVRENTSKTVISYNVDNKEYSKTINAYSSAVQEGDKVAVYYDKNEPDNIKVRELSNIAPMVLGIIGGSFSIIAIIGYIVIFINKKCYSNNKKI